MRLEMEVIFSQLHHWAGEVKGSQEVPIHLFNVKVFRLSRMRS